MSSVAATGPYGGVGSAANKTLGEAFVAGDRDTLCVLNQTSARVLVGILPNIIMVGQPQCHVLEGPRRRGGDC